MATVTFANINDFSAADLRQIGLARFEGLLDSVSVKERLAHWPKIRPSTLERLPIDMREALLDRLPQCGALKQRMPGDLRVLSLGFNVHIAGNDRRCPYPIDFCVRINGYQAAINLLLRPDPELITSASVRDMKLGPETDFFEVMDYLSQSGFGHRHYYQLILLKMFRPCCPNALQWGTAGGVFAETEENQGGGAARFRGWKETQQEFRGYKICGWAPLVNGGIYQSGNVYEIQYIGVTIGYIPEGEGIELAESEGIIDWQAIPFSTAESMLQVLKLGSPDESNCIFPDEKICHGLSILSAELAKRRIVT